MGILQILKKFSPLMILICSIFFNPILAQFQRERNALYSLKANFNDPFLNSNWSGPHCVHEFVSQWHGIRCSNGRVTGILLENMSLNGTISKNVFSVFTELTILSLKNNLISGELPNFSSNLKIREINLSGNKFSGSISGSLVRLSLLESLLLQDNNLTGYIPEFNQSNLKVFDVSNNNLQGEIPKSLILQSFGFDSFPNNPELCGTPTKTVCSTIKDAADTNQTAESGNASEPDKSSSKPTKFEIMFLLFDLVGLLAVILLFILYFRKAKRLKKMVKQLNLHRRIEAQIVHDRVDLEAEQDKSLHTSALDVSRNDIVLIREEKPNLSFLQEEMRFELNDLLKASAEGLGKGIFGNSYKAMMEGLPALVVKRLRDLKPLSSEEFIKHLNEIADLKHPNLMPILAYYYSKAEKLMIYKFAEKGNVFNRIHGERGKPNRIPFRWSSRLSVARGVARALEYLHLSKTPCIVPHGNLKSSNVLLDENETVLVADYCLTSLIALPIACNRMVSYKSPEYQTNKQVSKKSDVWSYGCFVLELLTGRAAAHSAPPGTNGVDLCGWVHRAVREEWTAEIFDTELSGQRNSTPGMVKLLQIAIRCCHKFPDKRPEMTEIVRDVEKIDVVESDGEDSASLEQSLTDESLSTSTSGIVGDER